MAAISQKSNLCDVSCRNLLLFRCPGLKPLPAVLSPETEVRVCAFSTHPCVRWLTDSLGFAGFSNHNYCGKTCSQQAAAMNQTSTPQNGTGLCKVFAPSVCLFGHRYPNALSSPSSFSSNAIRSPSSRTLSSAGRTALRLGSSLTVARTETLILL